MLRAPVLRTVGLRAFPKLTIARSYSAIDRYKKQLEDRAKKEGISIEDLWSRAKAAVENVKENEAFDPLGLVDKAKKAASKSTDVKDAQEAVGTDAHEQSVDDEVARLQKDVHQPGSFKEQTKDLSTFVDAEKLKLHSVKEIEMIWKARFVHKDNEFCGSMLPEPFSRLYVNARKYPTFVLPLPHKNEGVELHFVQWSFVGGETIHCLITSLAEYKLHNEFATPHTTVLFHTNFLEKPGIVLINTDVEDKRLPVDQAVLLTLTLQRFYTADASSEHGQQKLELLKEFNQGDESFTVDRLLEATETLD